MVILDMLLNICRNLTGCKFLHIATLRVRRINLFLKYSINLVETRPRTVVTPPNIHTSASEQPLVNVTFVNINVMLNTLT